MRRILSSFVLLLACVSSGFAQQPVGVPTYYGSVANFATAASATDVACLEGAAGKVVKLTGAYLAGTTAAPASIDLLLLRRITLNVGGTTNVVVPASGNPTHSAASAKLKLWSVNPTTAGDTAAPPIGFSFRRLRWDVTTTLSPPTSSQLISDQASNPYTSQPEIRSATQAICLNYNSAAAPVTTINLNVVWTETDQ